MNEAAIIQDFEKPSPRKVCRKKDSPEEGVGFNPWGGFGELGGCSGVFLGVVLLLALVPAIREWALAAAALFAIPVVLMALYALVNAIGISRRDTRLAQYGEAVIGQVTRLQSIDVDDRPRNVILEYQFRTRSGRELNDKREAMSGWYDALLRENKAGNQDGQVVIIYLPDNPKENEPYNSLSYRICE